MVSVESILVLKNVAAYQVTTGLSNNFPIEVYMRGGNNLRTNDGDGDGDGDCDGDGAVN